MTRNQIATAFASAVALIISIYIISKTGAYVFLAIFVFDAPGSSRDFLTQMTALSFVAPFALALAAAVNSAINIVNRSIKMLIFSTVLIVTSLSIDKAFTNFLLNS
ncbi:hypothetical protein [Novosphingobium sp. SG751A]|uniref:hypothetical protein n=1 Tax=Novosphingobium sp. SG751A TaxID=2587000 RepID=UPI001556B7FF|nr:hypothetical protein [Novosphingobium sp. SG751A]